MFRAPRSANVHAMAEPLGAATRFAGNGKSSTCSSEKSAPFCADVRVPKLVAQMTATTTSVQTRRKRVIIVSPFRAVSASRIIIIVLLESLVSDIRYALRWFRKSPGFTAVAVASLAIGIGFNTALFTIVDALLFKPLPVSRPDRLVDVYTSAPSARASAFGTTSYPDYIDLKARNEVFDDVIAYTPMFGALSTDVGARLAMGEVVSGNYFRVLGVPAFMGRTITAEDDT